jgi:hypothetical protein
MLEQMQQQRQLLTTIPLSQCPLLKVNTPSPSQEKG